MTEHEIGYPEASSKLLDIIVTIIAVNLRFYIGKRGVKKMLI